MTHFRVHLSVSWSCKSTWSFFHVWRVLVLLHLCRPSRSCCSFAYGMKPPILIRIMLGALWLNIVVDVNKSLASSSKSHFFLGVVLSRRNFFSCVCALIRVERYGGGQQQEPANHRNPRIVVQADLWNIGIIINLLEKRRRSTRWEIHRLLSLPNAF